MKAFKDTCHPHLFYIPMCFLCCTFIFGSCLEEPKVKLLQSDNEYIDSIFSQSIDSLRAEVDSICVKERDILFLSLVDSITEQRLAEIETIFNQK